MVVPIIARGLVFALPKLLRVAKPSLIRTGKFLAGAAAFDIAAGTGFTKSLFKRPKDLAGLAIAPIPAAAGIIAREFKRATVQPNITLRSGKAGAISASGKLIKTFPKGTRPATFGQKVKRGLIGGGIFGAAGAVVAGGLAVRKKFRGSSPSVAILDQPARIIPGLTATSLDSAPIGAVRPPEKAGKRRRRRKTINPITNIIQIQNAINI